MADGEPERLEFPAAGCASLDANLRLLEQLQQMRLH
jgi:hypothetical protein